MVNKKQEIMTTEINSFFRVTKYMTNRCRRSKLSYPTFRVRDEFEMYFGSLDRVEDYMRREKAFRSGYPLTYEDMIDTYAYVVVEIPIGIEVNIKYRCDVLSVRIYLPDGTLWGENNYSTFMPILASIPDEYNYWGKRNQFWGRNPEEIKFKPGDIVEIFGYPGNGYWSEEVNLAVIISTPPTKDEVAEMRKQYMATHSGFDLCDHALSLKFGRHLDTYEVVSPVFDGIDHAATISVFEPSMPISARRRKIMNELYNKYKDTNYEK